MDDGPSACLPHKAALALTALCIVQSTVLCRYLLYCMYIATAHALERLHGCMAARMHGHQLTGVFWWLLSGTKPLMLV